jgi:hypothetical protein
MSESVASAAPAAAAVAPASSEPENKAPASAAADVAAPSAPAKHKVKIDGAEQEVTLDELVKGYQLEGTSRKRMSEAAKLQSEAKSLESKLKAGGEAALRAAGWTEAQLEELSVQVLSAKHAQALEAERLKAMDPKERENHELKKKLQEHEEKAKKESETSRTSQIQQTQQQITNAVIETLEQFPESMRKSPLLADRCLSAWESALMSADELQAKGVQISAKRISDQVMTELRGLSTGLLTHAKDDELEQLVPSTVRARWGKKPAPSSAGHPELAGKPVVREAKRPEDLVPVPRVKGPSLLRRLGGRKGA